LENRAIGSSALQNSPEKAALIGISRPPEVLKWQAEEHLEELEELADTAGAKVLFKFIQERKQIDPVFAIGSGKVQELKLIVEENEMDLVIFDDDLSPAQKKNLERELGCKILDRTALILQIFAVRAKSAQAKHQVELAQLEYLLPRLTRQWTHLSKQKGGIGTKGPGETQIETDRRLIWRRISTLKQKLKVHSRQRETRTNWRQNITKIALVGYTNAGKSTLMNALCPKANAHSEDRLFATLDTTTRRLHLKQNKQAILSDTVGFIRKLPHNLVESFKSTLEEVREADILLHVVDVSHPAFEDHIHIVAETLNEIDAKNKQTILVLNKIDRLPQDEHFSGLAQKFDNAVLISAARGINLSGLMAQISDVIQADFDERFARIHVSDYKLISYLHEKAEVISKRYDGEEVEISFRVPKKIASHIDGLLERKSKQPH